jgi:acyl carrier protein
MHSILKKYVKSIKIVRCDAFTPIIFIRRRNMQRDEIKDKFVEVINDNLTDIEDVNVSANFVDDYDVNSIQLIQLIVAAEDEFGVSFDDKELALSRYETFDDVIDTIDSKINK